MAASYPAALGKTLLIANPAAQNGKGASAALYAGDVLRKALPAGEFDLVMTEAALHGRSMVEHASGYQTILALGGDGLVHEIMNGLMPIPEDHRPIFGLLPVGTGNDYARTLRMDFDIRTSVQQIQQATPSYIDVGLCNGEYFAETLSFGLDAAIALDTVDRRKRTGKTGTRVFFESGLDVLLHQLRIFDYELVLDDGKALQDEMFILAVQIGKTYGGGFKICPDAEPDDGLFDICIAHPPLGLLKAVTIFMMAKSAKHTKFKQLEFAKAEKLVLRFGEAHPPIQIDGEPLQGDAFEITCVKHALKVLMP